LLLTFSLRRFHTRSRRQHRSLCCCGPRLCAAVRVPPFFLRSSKSPPALRSASPLLLFPPIFKCLCALAHLPLQCQAGIFFLFFFSYRGPASPCRCGPGSSSSLGRELRKSSFLLFTAHSVDSRHAIQPSPDSSQMASCRITIHPSFLARNEEWSPFFS